MKLSVLCCSVILFISSQTFSQSKKLDSLKIALKDIKSDTTRCSIYYTVSETASDDEWPLLNREALKIAEENLKKNLDPQTKMTFSIYLGYALCNEALYISNIESPRKAFSVYNRALIIFNNYNRKSDVASVIKNIGETYNVLRIRDTALIYFKKALKIFEEINDEEGMAGSLNNIGYIYLVVGNKELGEEYLLKSLKIAEKIKDEAQIAQTLSNLVAIYDRKGDLNKAYEYSYRSYLLYKSVGNMQKVSSALLGLSFRKSRMGEHSEADKFCQQSLEIAIQLKDIEQIGSIYHTMAGTFLEKGKIASALEYVNSSLRIFDSIGNSEWQSHCLELLASIYSNQGDKLKALEYFEKAKKVFEKNNDSEHVVLSLLNIAAIKDDLGNEKESTEMYQQVLIMARKMGYNRAVINILNHFGVRQQEAGNLDKALEYFLECKTLSEELKDLDQMALTYYNISFIKLRKNEVNEAEFYGKKCLELSNKLKQPSDIRNASKIMFQVYKVKNNFKGALEMHELYMKMKDSVNSEITMKASLKSQFKYDFEKKEAEVRLNAKIEQEKIKLKAAEEKKQQNIIIYSVIFGLVLACIFSVFIFRSLQKNKKANKIISAQKLEVEKQHKIADEQRHLVEEHQKEIIDSINYAQRIQRSLLASATLLNNNLPDYFIFFKPKDIVSGDFYWASELKNNQFALVTADSTGHGVPGAIMSMLNIACLNEAVTKGITKPNEILFETRKGIIEHLKNDGSTEGGKDGMDCSLLCFDFKNKILTCSAANNPVWIVRKTSLSLGEGREGEAEIIEIKPDKMPVGKHDKDKEPFTLHTQQLQSGDTIYALTDGFPDQFGGPKGKKFMSKALKELLIANVNLPMNEQRNMLETTFKSWIGNLEQIDDVTIMGVRV